MRVILAALALCAPVAAQRWQDTCGRTESGVVALQQAVKDVAADALVLLVASHPDDRYVLPAVWLRYTFGVRIAVLLATRGGGGQNLGGPETGDSLERIRTLETEAGCSRFGGEVWYLDRPDAGYRRTAEETFAEWGKDGTLRDLVRLIRTIRPDCVVTTHHAEELHGHDLALVDLLPQAVVLAADASYATDRPAFTVRSLLLGAGAAITANTLRIDAERLEPVRGASLRRLAYDILRDAHVSPGPPAPIDTVFETELRLQPATPMPSSASSKRPLGWASVFDADLWPGTRQQAEELDRLLSVDLPRRVAENDSVLEATTQALVALRDQAVQMRAVGAPDDVSIRLQRRVSALERLLLQIARVQIELDVTPGTVAVAGEEFDVALRLHTEDDRLVSLRVEGLDGVSARLEEAGEEPGAPLRTGARAQVSLRIPLDGEAASDPMAQRFHGDRFVPPVRLRLFAGIGTTQVPIELTVPVELRAPVELTVVPHMLLLPATRREVQFSVGVARHSRFPVVGELEVRAPAGYGILDDRANVELREVRSDLFGFSVAAPDERKPGVDVFRIRLGGNGIALPVHKVDVKMPADLRIGLLRSRDDTIPGILGTGGLGLPWSDLSDTDIAVADLRAFDTIVVDIRALRDRPDGRRGFRRLLEFASGKGRRLVVFYQKDTEFHPAGEGFMGAPYQPFHVGRTRVTRADAPVRILAPGHPLLTHPNTIQPGDWDGWEQERALYLPSAYAAQYEEILAIHDPGEPEERGALLYARTGEGEYVYCALALWRQLKKLHPGAVRILANLLSPSRRE